MDLITISLVVSGLVLFEVISSVDNAIINAEVLRTMSGRAKRWFLLWGLLFAVFVLRGVLPWIIIWATSPSLGLIGSLTATFSQDPSVIQAIEQSSPLLMMAGGVFLVFLFIYWLFLEEKHFGLPTEKFFFKNGVWFYSTASVILCFIVWHAAKINPLLAFAAVVGSTVFFVTHGFKQNAEMGEQRLMSGRSGLSDISKILYLEVIDATFSIDGVLGAFAFTLSVPLILIGNGIGAYVVRQITVSNIRRIKKYRYLKNGAMYSILFLGLIMTADGFGARVPEFASPIITFAVIGYFFWRSVLENRKEITTCR